MNHDKLTELARNLMEHDDVKEIVSCLEYAINLELNKIQNSDKFLKTTEIERKRNNVRERNLEHLHNELDGLAFFVMPKEDK